MTTTPLKFVRRGEIVTLHGVPPTRTLLEVLREDLHCTGTKEGCNEGDCGACTVVVGESVNGELRTKAVNSCIKMAHSLNGKALWTVEDIATDDGRLHPAQEAMVQCHGSQCGFCTPGFVMSLFDLYRQHAHAGAPITRDDALHALSGNLCRCTGYRPILDAAQTMLGQPAVDMHEAETLSKLELLTQEVRGLEPDSSYISPTTLPALLAARAQHPEAQIVAGCTDVGLWVTKMHKDFSRVLDVTQVAELRRVEQYPHHIAIGAAVTLTDAFAALVADRPQLATFASRFAGLPVRNAGTLGGNVANGSPIGDSMPLLIALGASVVLMAWRGKGNKAKAVHRELRLEDLYTGYRQNVMAPDEVLAWIKVPKAGETTSTSTSAAPGRPKQAGAPSGGSAAHAVASVGAEFLRVYKISKRFEDDISAVCLALNLHIEGGMVTHASIGVGGVAATPVRALKTQAALLGKPWNLATVKAAQATLRGEFSPISDMRASSAYRVEVLGNLLQRYWLESQGLTAINLESYVLTGDAA
ncbi:XdhA Xanthine dehydrogenase, iron-sulfur cluster and FAD-binding subunit A [Comamonadaceae bacterium]